MSKRELIDAIRQHNRTVAPEFLARFGENDLEEYLKRVYIVSSELPHETVAAALETQRELIVA